jgi:hypothetical protein
MLIKREQRERMGDPAFVDRTVDRLRTYFLQHVYMLDVDELRFRVRHAIEKARSYGLTYESSITTFVAHMMTVNPAFDEHPAVQRALRDPDVAPDGRMTAMMATVSDMDWEEAARQRDRAAYWAEVHEKQAKEG